MGLDMSLYREVRLSDDTKTTGKEWEKVGRILEKAHTIKKQEVCYWRKFNALHKYFADNFNDQDSDNCVDMYLEIEDIRNLRDKLKKLAEKIKLGEGAVCCYTRFYINGEIKGEVGDEVLDQLPKDDLEDKIISAKITYKTDKNIEVAFYEKGTVIANPEVCKEELPTEGGFFFGTTEYNEWYAEDVKNTVEMLDKIIAEHNELVKTVKEYDITYYYRAWY